MLRSAARRALSGLGNSPPGPILRQWGRHHNDSEVLTGIHSLRATQAFSGHPSAPPDTHDVHEQFWSDNPAASSLKSSNKQLNKQAAEIAEATNDALHFKKSGLVKTIVTAEQQYEQLTSVAQTDSSLPHPIWTPEAANQVRITHMKPTKRVDRIALRCVRAMRFGFDVFSGYKFGRVDERAWLTRIAFLETVAGVPGMVGAMIRHLNSLRRMERDHGWIHTLLEEAENERMHLMTALILKKPSPLFRFGVLLTQGFFIGVYSVSYMVSPRFAHRFVGYLEEEAVITYSHLLSEIDKGNLPLFSHLPAPPMARHYWQLPENAMIRDVFLAIRADESHHREVNHTFAEMKKNETNPFPPGH